MGSEEIHSETIEQEAPQETASYDIICFKGIDLPDAYKGMVFSRWMRSHRYGNFLFKMIDSDVYYDRYSKYISQILAHKDCELRLAVLSDDHDVALGFCCTRGNILDYVHVHHSCRENKIATHLTPAKIKCITHWTYQGEKFATKRYGRWTFNPYA